MAQCVEISVHPNDADEAGLKTVVAKHLGVDVARVRHVVEERRAIDARKRKVLIWLRVRVYLDGETPVLDEPTLPSIPTLKGPVRVVVVGAGPAGMFAAWRLAMAGHRPLVVERGGNVRGRRPALAALNRSGTLDPENNYCFGEGGAGTFSDGKLYTRVKKGPTRTVLELLAASGAPQQILIDSRPHIGTNRLPKVVQTLRDYLIAAGVEFAFDTRVDDFVFDGKTVKVVQLRDGREVRADAVVLATGHSARDIYELCSRRGIHLESKPYAMGVRIEHPQAMIDEIQYGGLAAHPQLGAAPYSLKQTVDGIGVYSFCMCPGGFIVPAATQSGQLVVNGMSPSKRNSKFANSGFVVTVDEAVYGDGVLDGLTYQAEVEKAAYAAGGEGLQAPAQRVDDFVAGRVSDSLPECSYRPGLVSSDLDKVLPKRIAGPMRSALKYFDSARMRGYVSNEAVLVGVESRSSAPIRIPRDAASRESLSHADLYPTGEGAGFAGGIVSAALDGLRVADAIARKLA